MAYSPLWQTVVGDDQDGFLSGKHQGAGNKVFRVDADKGFELLDIDWDVSSHAVIEFAPGIGPRQLRLQRADGNHGSHRGKVHVVVTLPGKGNKVSLINFATHAGQAFRFADGSSWNGATILDRADQAWAEKQWIGSWSSGAASGKACFPALATTRYAERIHARLL